MIAVLCFWSLLFFRFGKAVEGLAIVATDIVLGLDIGPDRPGPHSGPSQLQLDTVISICRKQAALCLSLDAASKTIACLSVSTRSQDLANQKLAILDHACQKHFVVDRFVEVQACS